MKNSDSSETFNRLSSNQLSRLLSVDENTPETWDEADMRAMFDHQMAAPLDFDLRTLPTNEEQATALDTTITQAAAERVQTFRDLYFHPNPLPELLVLAKHFFKKQAAKLQKESPEWQLAYMFYLLSILVARTRHPEITQLTDPQLLKGVNWALEQSWVDESTREVLQAAQRHLSAT